MNKLPNIWLFWTGWAEYWKWWSGIEKILEAFWTLEIKDAVKIIVSDNWNGWVREKAYNGWIQFHQMRNFPNRWDDWNFSENNIKLIQKLYQEIVKQYDLDYVFLSGWLKYVTWLAPNKTVNIHPGPLQEPYGWKGMYGMNIHKKVWEDYVDWKINQTCVSMHYVTDNFDDGPIIVQLPISLVWCNSPMDIQKRVNDIEHIIQWKITEMIMSWDISWSWVKWEPVKFPENFTWGKEVDLMEGTAYKNRKT
jgi:folate-dependent phosphoribosylglycinamide formyltransferase PurN